VSEFKLKEQMCDIGQRIWLKGFCAGNEGNHSVRIGEGRFLCTPSGISKARLKADEICVVDADGKQLSGRRPRSSEFMMHAAIYKARPDVNAVVHSHPPHATAFAIAGVELPTCIHPEAEVFLGPVRTARYVTPGDNRLGESILPYLNECNTILLGNHGVVCYAGDLEQAYYQLEIVDAYARILLLARQLGSVQTLTGDQMSELIQLKARFGLSDPRTEAATKNDVQCTLSDFMSRVGGEVGTRGRMMHGDTAGPLRSALPAAGDGGPTESEFEQLVQAITDQVMASA
jgi:L-fuculose-phosphate aldolase